MENTCTLTSESTDGHYISLRPLLAPTAAQAAFPFEWAFAGTNKDITVSRVSADTVKEEFRFGFDTNVYLDVKPRHEGPVETYWQTIASGVRQETGEIFPAGKTQPGVKFMEMWQPVDFASEKLVIIGAEAQQGRSVTLKIDSAEFQGLVIVVGKWVQGFLSRKRAAAAEGLSFVRAFEVPGSNVDTAVKFGKDFDKFPTLFDALKVGQTVDANGAQWEVIEAHY
ncbi:Hri1 protein [Maudiozyma humilis]|uniref:Hri1 protein n=1 Tax=Maudiozyma humilis TaxID=51915 RepID=A0AAV5RUQ6_MAUHU|nr:Hri1 protein [Kazachstania humilis]